MRPRSRGIASGRRPRSRASLRDRRHQDVAHRASRALDAPQIRPDHPLTADGADRPAPVSLEPDRVLGHEDAPLPPRTRSQPRPMLGQRGGGTRDAEGDGMGQGRSVARGLQPQRIRVVQAVAAVEIEGDRVEAAAVMDRPTAPPPSGRRDPVRELVQQREPLVERVACRRGRRSSRPIAGRRRSRVRHAGHATAAAAAGRRRRRTPWPPGQWPRPARSSALSQQPADLEQPRVEVRRRRSFPRRR